MIRVLKLGFAYFAIVFAVGFLLGMMRVPLLVPSIGERLAELIELPFLLAAIFLSSRWIVRHFELWSDVPTAFGVGMVAAALLLLVEFSVVLGLRGMTVREFLASRDPVAAALYYAAVGIFSLMPLLLSLFWRTKKNE